MDLGSTATERRAVAAHPGRRIAREYLEPLGLDAADFAMQIGLDAARLTAMLEGRLSLDVDAAVRIARALQISAERIMQMQLQCDFAAIRGNPSVAVMGVLQPPPQASSFPPAFIVGRLACAADESSSGASLFFKQTIERPAPGDPYAGLHALWRGDRLRIYGEDGAVLWIGPVLQALDGEVLLPYAAAPVWQRWFSASYRADLAFGPEHAAFFERMSDE